MGIKSDKRGRVDAALGAIVANGCFCLAFTVHLLGKPDAGLTFADCFGMGVILCVLLGACWVIYHEHWRMQGEPGTASIKRLRIKELNEGAAIEFDGKKYRIDNIDRSRGEILIERIGYPGSIVVQIEGEG